MGLCTSTSVNSTKAQVVHDVCSNALPESSNVLKIESDTNLKMFLDQCVLGNFSLHHCDLVPGSNIIRADRIVNANSEKWPSESRVLQDGKQDCCISVCTSKQVAIVNNETKTDYYATSRLQTLEATEELSSSILDNNVSASYDLNATVPSYDITMTGCCSKYDLTEKHYPNQLSNCEEIPIVPESPNTCKTGLLAVTCMDTSYQDSSVPSISPVNESYCLTLCCFAAEKESLFDEESDYELNLSPTQESFPYDNAEVSIIDSSQVSCDDEGHHDVITSPAESVSKSDVIDTSPDSSGLADTGVDTLLQELPLEMARQTDTEILQVCKRPIDSRENTDDYFDGNAGRTQKITSSQLPNQNFIDITNSLYSESCTEVESGRRFPMEQVDYDHANNNNNSIGNLQAVPSDDHSLDDAGYDGPSKLLMAMELAQRKDHHVPGPLNTSEGMFSRSYLSKSINQCM